MTTIVTAYYPIRSKYPPQQYLEWAQRFLQLAAPIVLFTEPHLVNMFKALCPEKTNLHILAKPFEALEMWVQYEQQWRAQVAMDHEAAYHTPELYAVWAQKPTFVAEAICQNPFKTEYFYWCDIGAFREPVVDPEILAAFPTSDLFHRISAREPPPLLMNSVAPLQPAEWVRQPDGILGDFKRVNRIVGGLWGGTAAACLRWGSAYEAQLIRYFQAGRFAGKDQSVMLSAYLEDPRLAVIARPTTKAGDHWYFQEYLLTGNAPFEQDLSYLTMGPPPPPITVKLMGGLGNQMFQIAAAWAAAREHGGTLVLRSSKEEEDGRPLYWSTVFHRFQHVLASTSTPLLNPTHWEPAATEYAPIPAPSSMGLRLQGYFQSPLYFQQYASELRALFKPRAADLAAAKAAHGYLLEMQDRVVVVHARRGDYLKAADHHGPLTAAYYRAAMAAMAAHVNNPYYVLVADDPLWWIDVLPELPHLQTAPFTILMEDDEVVAFTLLQQFRHYILANSTYSWWFAYLAAAATVVAPKQWFGPAGPKRWEDLYLPSWIRV